MIGHGQQVGVAQLGELGLARRARGRADDREIVGVALGQLLLEPPGVILPPAAAVLLQLGEVEQEPLGVGLQAVRVVVGGGADLPRVLSAAGVVGLQQPDQLVDLLLVLGDDDRDGAAAQDVTCLLYTSRCV